MFSPEPITETISLRLNPRRRRRNEADISQRHPRKRSRIASESFNTVVNGSSAPSRSIDTNGSDTKDTIGRATYGYKSDDLTLRGKRVLSGNISRTVKDTSTLLASETGGFCVMP